MKAILFDFDGVLTIDKYGSDSILRYLDENTDVPIEVLKKEYYKINKGLLYGEYTHKDVWNEYCANVNAEIDFQILVDSFINTPLDNEMVSIVKELKKKYLIGMITDNKVDRIDTILKHHCLTDLFDTGYAIAFAMDKKIPVPKNENFLGVLNLMTRIICA